MKNQNEDGTWNLDTELDQESHAQLRDLWNVTALRNNAANLGVAPEQAARAEFWTYEEYQDAVAKAAEKPAEDEGGQDPDPNAGTGSVPTPAAIGDQQASGTGLGSQPEAPEDPTPGSEGVRAFADPSLADKPYEDWTNDQLKAEIAKRNELRDGNALYADDEPMKTDGNKADLVGRLTEDDEADAPE